jgi:hypothetical protein
VAALAELDRDSSPSNPRAAASLRESRTSPRRPRPSRAARGNNGIEAVVMAIAMALFLKHFVIEAFQDPDRSMQPTLIGDEAAGHQGPHPGGQAQLPRARPRALGGGGVPLPARPLEELRQAQSRASGPEELRFRER